MHAPHKKMKKNPDYVCKFQHSIDGLKQAPHTWFHHFCSYRLRHGFTCSPTDTLKMNRFGPPPLKREVRNFRLCFSILHLQGLDHVIDGWLIRNFENIILYFQAFRIAYIYIGQTVLIMIILKNPLIMLKLVAQFSR